MKDYNLRKLHDDLTENFIYYQHRLENPMPTQNESKRELINRYQTDFLFHKKVDNITYNVMRVIEKYVT